MYPAKLLEIYKRKMFSHGGQIDKATNLVRVYYTTQKLQNRKVDHNKCK